MEKHQRQLVFGLSVGLNVALMIILFIQTHLYRPKKYEVIKYIITDKGILDSNYNNITVEQYDSLCNMFNYYYLNAANDRIKNNFNK